MKQIISILLVLLIFCSCKESKNQNTEQITNRLEQKKDSVSEPPIKIIGVVFDSIYKNPSVQLNTINESLNELYKEAKKINNKEYLDRRINDIKLKRFAKSLAKQFDNDDFTRATQINASFLTKKEQKNPGDVRIEEWYFKDENTAKSCFESLIEYEERELYFNFISWIWVQQNNKLFLIFTTEFNVDEEPMQTVKRHLTDVLSKQGEYGIIEMH
ncbi:hypothetical protein [Zobellia galactanivorans]|uniref:hypothetical protein n=1 Tax=Zobellia galactanivorans (strain DSM 12802 / CCUG 47099 / CIP 106680 / NCIMB 13871 / Dsij) TaxID=63186 RepID=UPI001C074C4F|nr:hypothetical protein [Zobellia galactanivorans]MBU3024691.1 hypothetical protein [Zobellia galactanivorans]